MEHIKFFLKMGSFFWGTSWNKIFLFEVSSFLGNFREQKLFYLKQVHFWGTFHGTFPILTLVAGLNLIYR
jgi:hypothetical protein